MEAGRRSRLGQVNFSGAEYAGKRKKVRHEVCLEVLAQIIPWKTLLFDLAALPVARRGTQERAAPHGSGDCVPCVCPRLSLQPHRQPALTLSAPEVCRLACVQESRHGRTSRPTPARRRGFHHGLRHAFDRHHARTKREALGVRRLRCPPLPGLRTARRWFLRHLWTPDAASCRGT